MKYHIVIFFIMPRFRIVSIWPFLTLTLWIPRKMGGIVTSPLSTNSPICLSSYLFNERRNKCFKVNETYEHMRKTITYFIIWVLSISNRYSFSKMPIVGDGCRHFFSIKKPLSSWCLLLSFIIIAGKCIVYDVTIKHGKVKSCNYL